jgi:hypothetical protein
MPFRALSTGIRLLLGSAALSLGAAGTVQAAPQDPPAPPTSVERVKDRLETPIVRSLTPSATVRLRPVFKSGVEKHPFVRTLDQDLHQTFDLNDLQRQSAAWSSRCCGLDLGAVYRAIKQANTERQVSKTRAQIARELAELKSASDK